MINTKSAMAELAAKTKELRQVREELLEVRRAYEELEAEYLMAKAFLMALNEMAEEAQA